MIAKINLNDLNEEQRKAVTTYNCPVLVLAGAGSGKTRVLTYRIAHLINNRISPFSILAVTFTNKAANEMKERVARLVGNVAKDIWIGTFHSICLRMLRQYGSRIGYSSNFVIYDQSDQLGLVKNILKAENIDSKLVDPKQVLSEIEKAKTENIPPEKYDRWKDVTSSFFISEVNRIYPLYQKGLYEKNAMDFNDILINGMRLLEDNKDVLDYYQEKFKYIHIDEYQDTNLIQYRIINLLSDKHKNVCAVGDEDQAIYGWRGADIRNILNFENDFPNCIVVKLEMNYRSTGKILKAASEMIKNNTTSKRKYLKSSLEDGENIKIFHARDAYDEARYIAEQIKNMIFLGYTYSDFAIFYRVNWLSRVFETIFREEKIPHKIVGGFRFYERREVKEIIAYLRLSVNTQDDMAFQRIINVPKRSIGKTSIEKIRDLAYKNNTSMFDICINRQELIKGVLAKKIAPFAELIKELNELSNKVEPVAFVETLLKKTNLIDFFMNQDDGLNRIDNIKEFVSAVREYELNAEKPSVSDFIQNVSLHSDTDEEVNSGEVVLMTLHNAKGLEFPVVFIAGLEEEVLPHSRCFDEEMQLEEERRLFYVGITRGMKKLYITFTYTRNIYGNVKYSKPSRFLNELPEDVINF
ncbi:MAG: UvrD-helicase domain-containing protein [Candidatus Muirbacterium halophilum]|nr:UvrD-helicase domain-containing protein [Candidatus Muirbacterium halophilum]MCK9475995.1 UvrD-helicase domain-containing protein [Candidatus Muirbacterium halophilum]